MFLRGFLHVKCGSVLIYINPDAGNILRVNPVDPESIMLMMAARSLCAPVVELVDAVDSKSTAERRAGSSPAWGTIG